MHALFALLLVTITSCPCKLPFESTSGTSSTSATLTGFVDVNAKRKPAAEIFASSSVGSILASPTMMSLTQQQISVLQSLNNVCGNILPTTLPAWPDSETNPNSCQHICNPQLSTVHLSTYGKKNQSFTLESCRGQQALHHTQAGWVAKLLRTEAQPTDGLSQDFWPAGNHSSLSFLTYFSTILVSKAGKNSGQHWQTIDTISTLEVHFSTLHVCPAACKPDLISSVDGPLPFTYNEK